MAEYSVKDYYFLSANKYYDIHVRMWKPERDIRAILQIAHGMAEYIGRYDEFAGFLAENGILVVGNDHMGHGESINSSEDLGYISFPVKGFKGYEKIRHTSSGMLVMDMEHITKIVKKHYPGLPYFLLGHSMGSFLAQRYMIEYGSELTGAIIMGSGIKKKIELQAADSVLKAVRAKYGDRYRSDLVHDLTFAGYNDRFKDSLSENAWLCSDEKVVKEYDSDEKCGFNFTVNGYQAIIDTVKFIQKPENIMRVPDDLEILLTCGMDDPVGNYGEDVKKIQERYGKCGKVNVDISIYKGFRHEILKEIGKEVVFKDILNWIDDRR